MPTLKQKLVAQKIVENRGKSISKAMREVNYSEKTAKNPKNLTDSKGWQELMDERLSDNLISETHEGLLKSQRLDHMTFPLGCKLNNEKEAYIAEEIAKAKKQKREIKEFDILSDEDIIADLKSVNCTVRRIVHGEQARHVYFWSPDNHARKDAIDMSYKLKGRYAPLKVKNMATGLEDLTDEELDDLLKDKSFIIDRYKKYGGTKNPQGEIKAKVSPVVKIRKIRSKGGKHGR